MPRVKCSRCLFLKKCFLWSFFLVRLFPYTVLHRFLIFSLSSPGDGFRTSYVWAPPFFFHLPSITSRRKVLYHCFISSDLMTSSDVPEFPAWSVVPPRFLQSVSTILVFTWISDYRTPPLGGQRPPSFLQDLNPLDRPLRLLSSVWFHPLCISVGFIVWIVLAELLKVSSHFQMGVVGPFVGFTYTYLKIRRFSTYMP